MFGIDTEGRRRVDLNRQRLVRRSVLAVDMETDALLAAAKSLDVVCATLCLATVDAQTQVKLGAAESEPGERRLFETALKGLTELD